MPDQSGRVLPPDLCHNGHPFVPGVSTDHAPGESDPRWCNTCGEARKPGRGLSPLPFIIEYYEDWSDYPHWMELEVEGQESEETPRFASVAEARQWLDAYLDAQDEAALASWHAQERRVREGQALYERRMALLEREGLGHQEGIDWQNSGVVTKPPSPWKKPKGYDRKKYRVALDGPPCTHCTAREITDV